MVKKKLDKFFIAYRSIGEQLIKSHTEWQNYKTNKKTSPPFPENFAKKLVVSFEEDTQKLADEVDGYIGNLFDERKLNEIIEQLYQGYRKKIEKSEIKPIEDDPFFYKIDPFSVVNWGLAEVPHTKMLAFLLDHKREHGLGIYPMQYFLILLKNNCDLALNLDNISIKSVEPEKRITVNGEVKRLDILITLNEPKCRIILEGKIGSDEGENQCANYELWAEQNQESEVEDVYIYLSKDKSEKISAQKDWVYLKWKQVASAFCAILYDNLNISKLQTIHARHGLELLRLWCSTIIHSVCEIKAPKYPTNDLLAMIQIARHLEEIGQFVSNKMEVKNENK